MSRATAKKNVRDVTNTWRRYQDFVERHTPSRTGTVTDNAYTVSGKRGY